MKHLLYISFLFLSFLGLSQNPGGVTVSVWYKASIGVDNTTNNTRTYNWANQVSSSYNAYSIGSNGVYYQNNATENINFNPTLSFDGTSYFGVNRLPITNSSFTIIGVGVREDNGDHIFIGDDSDNGNFQTLTFGHVNNSRARLTIGSQNLNVSNLNGYNVPAESPFFLSGILSTTDGKSLKYYRDGELDISTDANTGTLGAYNNMRIGSSVIGNDPINGNLAEILVFSSALSEIEQLRVYSYLALKYAIPLTGDNNENSTSNEVISGLVREGDYIASDGTTVIWDYTLQTSTYSNTVVGIGRDDNSGLNQKQSKYGGSEGLITIGLTSIDSTNEANTNSFSADKQFLLWGNNAGTNAFTTTGAPTNRQILERVWRVAETGTVGTVKLQIPASTSSVSSKLPVAGALNLLVDDDGDFTSGATEYEMTLVGTNWEVDVDFSNSEYFTFSPGGVEINATTNGSESGPIDIVFTILLPTVNATGSAVTFDLNEANTGTAISGTDYTAIPANTQISIANGAQSATYTVTVLNDAIAEGLKTLDVTLSNSSSSTYFISKSGAVATIADDDGGPGGVRTNLNVWLKSDLGAGTANSNDVTSWEDQSFNGNNGTSDGNPPSFRDNATDNLNYNPVVLFDGSNDRLVIDIEDIKDGNGVGNGRYTIFGVGQRTDNGNNLVIGSQDYSYNQKVHFGYLSNGNVNFNNNASLSFSTNNYNNPAVSPFLLYTSSSSSGRTLEEQRDGIFRNASNTYTGTIQTGSTNFIGALPQASAYFQGPMAEIIVFEDVISDIEKHQLYSYLSLKYGLQLTANNNGNSTLNEVIAGSVREGDYVASDGTTIFWDYAANTATFYNDVAGIGRDDDASLSQRQSKSVSEDALVTMSSAEVATTNSANTTSFSSNKQFLLWGNNNGTVAFTSTGAPANTTILSRTWRVQETGALSNVTVSVPDNSSSLSTKLPYSGTLSIFQSTTNDFSSGATVTTMMLNGTNWEASVDFANGDYFTFGVPPTPANLSVTTNGSETGTVSAVYTVTLDAPNTTGSAITFDFDDSGTGTATSGADYSVVAGNAVISIANNASSGSISIPIIDDLVQEPTETIIAQISNASSTSVNIVTSTAAADIEDNDVGPGGITTNLEVWLRADKSTSTTVNNTALNTWSDVSGSGNDATQDDNPPAFFNNTSNNINFNPTVDFDGSNDRLVIDLSSIRNTDFTLFVIGERDNDDYNFSIGSQGGTAGEDLHFGYRNTGTAATLAFWSNDVNLTVSDFDVPAVSPYLLMGNQSTTDRVLQELRDGTFQSVQDNNITFLTGTRTNYIGDVESLSNYNGRISEVIAYSGSLSTLEVQRVYTYLGLKYAMLLPADNNFNSTNNEVLGGSIREGDYVASNNTVIWDYAARSASYFNNIAGIGRDDEAGLYQKQSKSGYTNALLTVGLESIATTNNSNTNLFDSDLSYMLWGHNNGTLAFTATGAPSSGTILSRVWQIEETGTVGSVKIRVPASTSTQITKLPSVSDLKIFVDTDGDFTSGSVAIAMSLVGTNWEVTIDLSDGDYISFGTQTESANLSVTTNGNEAGPVNIKLTVTLTSTNNTGSAITFDLDDLGTGSATSGSDYTAVAGSAIISVADGATTGTLNVVVSNDALVESLEDIDFQISNASSSSFSISQATATATITDNDVATADVSVTTNGDESGPIDIELTVTLSAVNNTGSPVTFDLDDLGTGSATSGSDYTAVAGTTTISVADGASIGTLTVAVTNDALVESLEDIDFQISNASSSSFTIGQATAIATITDNDVATADLSVTTNGDETGPVDIELTVTLSAANNTGSAVTFDLDDLGTGSATSGSDYTAVAGTATISVADGAITGTLNILVSNDALVESLEDIDFQISNASSSSFTIGQATAIATITDNDVATADLSVTTNGDETGPIDIELTVTLSAANNTGSAVTFDLDDLGTGSATSGSDYTAVAGTATISVADGATTGTLTVAVLSDALVEGLEDIDFQISNASSGSITIGQASATASITDLFAATADIAVTANGNEDGLIGIELTVTLTSTNNTGSPVTFDLDDLGTGSATSVSDYTSLAVNATISVANGASSGVFTIAVLDDALAEGPETVKLYISNPSISSVIIDQDTAFASIADDDADPSPGGVFTNLIFWYKGDAGVIPGTNGSAVTQWNDQSSGGRNATDFGTGATFNSVFDNYNPALDFASTTGGLTVANDNEINSSSSSEKAFSIVFTTGTNITTRQLIYEEGGAGNGINLYIENGELYANLWVNSADNADGTPILANTTYIYTYIYDGNSTPNGRWDGYLEGISVNFDDNVPSNLPGHTGAVGIGVINNNTQYNGAVDVSSGDEFFGKISEMAYYNQNVLSAGDRNKMHSYLATKYGITLTTNYIASNDITVWNQMSNVGYTSSIAGIGRDDFSTLNQKQSKSEVEASLVTIGLTTIESSNALNTNTFTTDYSTLYWGHNGGVNTFSLANSPANSQTIDRIWKVQETGIIGDVLIQIPAITSTATEKLQGLSSLNLLVDTDDDFTTGATAIPMTLNGTNWEALVDFNSGEFFTLSAPGVILSVSTNGNEAGPIDAVFTVLLSNTNNTGDTIKFDLTDNFSGTATSGIDYDSIPVNTKIYILNGASSGNHVVPIINDGFIEGTETFTLNISNPSDPNTIISGDSATANILDDDLGIIAPGGVSDGLTFWLKANEGTNTTTNGAGVTSWLDQSGNGNDATNDGTNPLFKSVGKNFNPAFDFSNDITGGFTIADNSAINNNGGTYAAKSFSIALVTGSDVTSRQMIFEQGGQTNGMNLYILNGDLIANLWNSSVDYAVSTAIDDSTTYVVSYVFDGNNSNIDLYVNGTLLSTNSSAPSTLSQHTGDIGIGKIVQQTQYVGEDDVSSDEGFTGYIMEMAYYNEKVFGAIERSKIESYFALKYGVTLSTGYVSANNDTIWDAASNTAFGTNVAGISSDGASDLFQKQATSSSENNLLSIGLGTVASSNNANGNSISLGYEFLIWGNNNAPKSGLVSNDQLVSGSGEVDRLLRKWKIIEFNDISVVQLVFNRDSIKAYLPFSSLENLYLKVADDSSLTTNSVYVALDSTLTVNGKPAYTANFDFSGTQYFTVVQKDALIWSGTQWRGGESAINEHHPSAITVDTLKSMYIFKGDSALVVEPITVNNVTVHDSADILITSTNCFNVSGSFTNNGGFVLEANKNGFAQYIGPAVTGTFQQYVDDAGWHLIGSPFSDVTFSDFNFYDTLGGDSNGFINHPLDGLSLDSCTQCNMWYYDVSTDNGADIGFGSSEAFGTWRSSASGGQNFRPDRGWNIYLDEGFNFSTAPFIIEITGTFNDGAFLDSVNENNAGWNLVANPYPSVLNWDKVDDDLATAGIANGYHVWNHENTNYAVYANGTGTLGTNQYIAPFQGFYVQTSVVEPQDGDDIYHDFELTNADRPSICTEDNSEYFKVQRLDLEIKLRITNHSSGKIDETAILLSPTGSRSFIPSEDINKLFTRYEDAPSLFSKIDDKMQAIATFPLPIEKDSIRISCRTKEGSSLTIETIEAPTGYNLYLEDIKTGFWHKIDEESYSFTQDQRYENRFWLHFSPYSIQSNPWLAGKPFYTYIKESVLYIKTKKSVLSATWYLSTTNGNVVKTGHIQEDDVQEYAIDISSLTSGVYFFVLITPDNRYTDKLLKL